jgi:3',5'-cyclic AMP phosphodiesterase CpdA
MRTIVHLSDVHFGRIDPATVAPLLRAIAAVRPDLTVLSGDLTQRARRGQFRAAREFVDALPRPRLVVPGNHDVPLWNAAARFLSPLARYKRFITADLSPVYRDDEVVVAGVSTVRSWTIGEGRISMSQVRDIVAALEAAPKPAVRIVVTHHPFDLPLGVGEQRLIGRAHSAMAELATAGADLFLAGHLHLSHIGHSAERYRIAGHSALIVQAGTVSTRSRGEQPSFNILRIERPLVSIGRLVWDPGQARFAEAAFGAYRHTADGWRAEASDAQPPGPNSQLPR